MACSVLAADDDEDQHQSDWAGPPLHAPPPQAIAPSNPFASGNSSAASDRGVAPFSSTHQPSDADTQPQRSLFGSPVEVAAAPSRAMPPARRPPSKTGPGAKHAAVAPVRTGVRRCFHGSHRVLPVKTRLPIANETRIERVFPERCPVMSLKSTITTQLFFETFFFVHPQAWTGPSVRPCSGKLTRSSTAAAALVLRRAWQAPTFTLGACFSGLLPSSTFHNMAQSHHPCELSGLAGVWRTPTPSQRGGAAEAGTFNGTQARCAIVIPSVSIRSRIVAGRNLFGCFCWGVISQLGSNISYVLAASHRACVSMSAVCTH